MIWRKKITQVKMIFRHGPSFSLYKQNRNQTVLKYSKKHGSVKPNYKCSSDCLPKMFKANKSSLFISSKLKNNICN